LLLLLDDGASVMTLNGDGQDSKRDGTHEEDWRKKKKKNWNKS
jgi:hypothetical protein